MALPTLLVAVAQFAATVVLAGDVVPHGDVLASVHAHGAPSLLGPLAGVLSRADLAVVNLETPVEPSQPESPDGTLRFNVHPDFVRALAAAGVDAVGLANNHGYDQGVAAVGETVRAVTAAGLVPAGAADVGGDPLAPARLPLAGRALCLLSVTRLLNFPVPAPTAAVPRLAMARPEVPGEERALLDRVRIESGRCGALVVFVHTGTEYADAPEPRDRVFFHALAAAGADAVVGHHSHTPQPVETYAVDGRVVPIFASLGNLVSAQGSAAERAPLEPGERFQIERDPRTREGLLAVLRFTPGGGQRLRLVSAGYVPLWTRNDRDAARATGAVPTVSAAAMPWNGGSERFLRARWASLVHRVGAGSLLPQGDLPGAETAYPPEVPPRR